MIFQLRGGQRKQSLTSRVSGKLFLMFPKISTNLLSTWCLASDCTPHSIGLGGIPLGINEASEPVTCCDHAETRRDIGLDHLASGVQEFPTVSISDGENSQDNSLSLHFLTVFTWKKTPDWFFIRKNFILYHVLQPFKRRYIYERALRKWKVLKVTWSILMVS